MKNYFDKQKTKINEMKMNNEIISSSDTIYKINSIKNIYSLTSLEDKKSIKSNESIKNNFIKNKFINNHFNQKKDKSTQSSLIVYKSQDEHKLNTRSLDENNYLQQEINFRTTIPKIRLSFVDETESAMNMDEINKEESIL